MEASFRASTELYNEISARNADFKAAIDAMRAVRGDAYLWCRSPSTASTPS